MLQKANVVTLVIRNLAKFIVAINPALIFCSSFMLPGPSLIISRPHLRLWSNISDILRPVYSDQSVNPDICSNTTAIARNTIVLEIYQLQNSIPSQEGVNPPKTAAFQIFGNLCPATKS